MVGRCCCCCCCRGPRVMRTSTSSTSTSTTTSLSNCHNITSSPPRTWSPAPITHGVQSPVRCPAHLLEISPCGLFVHSMSQTWILGAVFCLFASAYAEEVCYPELGCFSDLPPWGGTTERPNARLPWGPDMVGTRFLLFTQKNRYYQASRAGRSYGIFQIPTIKSHNPS
ncbi:hypothetical protein CRUP_005433 [Coryphaenoides rupestris]|nr:hypothetical protein CRUP_005433 [Coryphaenoides rupestris]